MSRFVFRFMDTEYHCSVFLCDNKEMQKYRKGAMNTEVMPYDRSLFSANSMAFCGYCSRSGYYGYRCGPPVLAFHRLKRRGDKYVNTWWALCADCAQTDGYSVEGIPIPEKDLPKKKCPVCGDTKPLPEFGADNSRDDGRQYACKECQKRRGMEVESRSSARKRRRTRYGITHEQYEKMLADQDRRCAICRAKSRLVIDHCHVTGVVRGLLCVPCNAALGLIERPAWLANVTPYLAPPPATEEMLETIRLTLVEAGKI